MAGANLRLTNSPYLHRLLRSEELTQSQFLTIIHFVSKFGYELRLRRDSLCAHSITSASVLTLLSNQMFFGRH